MSALYANTLGGMGGTVNVNKVHLQHTAIAPHLCLLLLPHKPPHLQTNYSLLVSRLSSAFVSHPECDRGRGVYILRISQPAGRITARLHLWPGGLLNWSTPGTDCTLRSAKTLTERKVVKIS